MPLGLIALVAMMALSAPATARAQDEATAADEAEASEASEEQARALFAQGARAFDEGRYDAALGFFEDAYRISGRHLLLYNIGQSQDRLRRDEEALATFRRYLEVVEDPPYRVQVESRIRSLEEAVERRQREHEALQAAQRREEELLNRESEGGSDSVAASTTTGNVDDEGDDGGILSQWWFWTIVGVVVVGGIAIGVGAAASGGTEEPIAGDVGGVVRALSF
jgi:tetratricopeptide (TPR) repeat protein